jgi:hypothetical protein
MALTQKVGSGHAHAISILRYRQDGDVDRVASAERLGGDDLGGRSNAQQFAAG